MMRVGIDAVKLEKGIGKSIGIYNYTKYLIEAFKDDAQIQLVIIGNESNRVDFEQKGVEFVAYEKINESAVAKMRWELFTVTSVSKKLKLDVIIYPRGFVPIFNPVFTINVVHDLIPFYYKEHYPEQFNKWELLYITTRLRQSVRQANVTVTISDYSLQDIQQRFHIKAKSKKVVRVYNPFICHPEPKEKPAPDSETQAPYIFAITSELPHKNPTGIMHAYDTYVQQMTQLGRTSLALKVVGLKHIDKYKTLLSQEALEKVTFFGFLENRDFNKVFANASVFLFLSEIEGFGYPPLEAMAYGIPTIVSNQTSLPEVVGNSAYLVGPFDYQGIAEALKEVSENKELSVSLIAKGYENIKRFDQNTFKKEFEKVFILKNKG